MVAIMIKNIIFLEQIVIEEVIL